ncbi:hypothetical protein Sjap_004739 [Stephania japonica]|uniref:Uncharacterized protein n=1 Tax=Stephania japonica TaxID=461633 RepID=A0AAP0PL64_9MAGN
MRAEVLKTPVQRRSAQRRRGDTVSVPTHGVTHVRLGRASYGRCYGDVMNILMHDVTHVHPGQCSRETRCENAVTTNGSRCYSRFASRALIQVCGYLIVARVRVGRPCSRPEPES